jgi:Alr-MurF fusion protein
MYTLSQIAEITTAKFIGQNDYQINQYLNDSRGLYTSDGLLFIALKTGRDNGHKYIPELIEKGVRSFLINEFEFDYKAYDNTDISFLLSKKPLITLQVLAAYHRQRFYIPVIGITGSNGKTVVKEWLYQILKNDYSICRSPKSYNSQIGVPLSVLNLSPSHTLAIFEAGISKPDEMEHLASIIRPTFGVLTSIGTAHDEGFYSREQKIKEKLILLKGTDKMFINGLSKSEVNDIDPLRMVFISESDDADIRYGLEKELMCVNDQNATYEFKIPFSDQASLQNIATCTAVLMQLGYKAGEIASRIGQLQSVALRLEIKKGINNSMLINDYYNSDLDSLSIALNYLHQKNRKSRKTVIVSDIEQSGLTSSELYRELGQMFSKNKIDLTIGIGKEISSHRSFFNSNSIFFENTEHAIRGFNLIQTQIGDSGILLKGARSFGFEHISRLLQLKSHDTIFEINLNKLISNVNYYKALLKQDTKLMCMVKAMGYGSGSEEVAQTLQHIGVDYLAVAYSDEGVELRNSQVNLPVMVMNPEEDAFEDIINFNLEPEIYSFRILHAFVKKLDSMGIAEPFPVHLKIDSGMHRLGFEEHELEALVHVLKSLPQIKVKSVFSHLAASDDSELDELTASQIQLFEKAFILIERELGYTVIKHICNSAGISRFKNAHFNMVRLGIGMYGIAHTAVDQTNLENAGSLKTRISQIKMVKKDEIVGYGLSGKVSSDTLVATIPIGYADGLNRLAGNGRHGLYVNSVFCKTLGNICMDMCMIDVSGVKCKEGDEVIVFENSDQLMALSSALGTIPYEILSSVSGRVKRVYVQE